MVDYETGNYLVLEDTGSTYSFMWGVYDTEVDSGIRMRAFRQKEPLELPVFDWKAKVCDKMIINWKKAAWEETKYSYELRAESHEASISGRFNSSSDPYSTDLTPFERMERYSGVACYNDEYTDVYGHTANAPKILYTTTPGSVRFEYNNWYYSKYFSNSEYTFAAWENIVFSPLMSNNGTGQYRPDKAFTSLNKANGNILWKKISGNKSNYTPDDWIKAYEYIPRPDGTIPNPIKVSYRLYFKASPDETKNDYYDDAEIFVDDVRVTNSHYEPCLVTPVHEDYGAGSFVYDDYIMGTFESYQTEIYDIEIDFHIAYPDELADPRLVGGNVYIYVAISAKQT
jgi:hypothetical protein